MGATIEIAYYNTFILAGGGTTSAEPGRYHVEESRIKGGFNEKAVDYGAKAYAVDDEYQMRRRENAMIYSGIFNSKTKVNNTNQFPIGANITKAVDITDGSIQKLHAEDTNLNIFQENKVSRALIDKDAIFTAEGLPLQAISNIVIGTITPYLGKHGIGKNPESFGFFGGRKYFADKSRGKIMRLSRDGLTAISDYGMKDWFRDNLPNTTHIYGSYDEQKGKYVVSLQGSNIDGVNYTSSVDTDGNAVTTKSSDYATVTFDERSNGWTSFYTYKPTFGFSVENKFFTYNKQNLYQHYVTDVKRNNFYGATYADTSSIELIFNDNASVVKNFLTLNYEGSTGWTAKPTAASYNNSDGDNTYTSINEEAYKIPKEGVIIPNTNPVEYAGFVRKEGKYFSLIRNINNDMFNDYGYFSTSGLRGNYLEVKLEYAMPSENTPDQGVSKAELFAVSSEIQLSSN